MRASSAGAGCVAEHRPTGLGKAGAPVVRATVRRRYEWR